MLGLGRAATVCLPLLVSVAVGILEEEWRGEVGAQVTPRLEHTMVGQWLLLSPVILLAPWSSSCVPDLYPVQEGISGNSVPMIGRRAGAGADDSQPQSSFLNLLKMEKKDEVTDYPWHLQTAALRRQLLRGRREEGAKTRIKRGPPRFGLPSHWNRKQGKRSPGLSGLRSHLYQNFRFHPNSWSEPLVQKRAPSFWEGAGEEEGRWLHKRAAVEEGEAGGAWPLNSVPFMGKRTLEEGEGGPGGQGMVLARVPREEQDDAEQPDQEEEITNPWDFLLLDPHRIWSRSSESETGNKIRNVRQALEMM